MTPGATNIFRVIVNNRDIDLNVLRFWYEQVESFDVCKKGAACSICYSKKRLATYEVCCNCSAVTCLPCHFKIIKAAGGDVDCDDQIMMTPYKCSTCQSWHVIGFGYGLSHKMLTPSVGKKVGGAINQFGRLLEHLDGLVHVLVRIDKVFAYSSDPMCRLFYPQKSGEKILTRPLATKDNTVLTKTMSEIRDLRKQSKSLDFMVYVVRNTSSIAENKPVVEISLFTVYNDNLIQFGVDAWVWPAELVSLFEMERSTVTRVAYLPPFNFKAIVPFDVLATMPVVAPSEEIACFIACGPKQGLDFDVKNGKMTTMHEEMVYARLALFIQLKHDIYIVWRRSMSDVISAALFCIETGEVLPIGIPEVKRLNWSCFQL